MPKDFHCDAEERRAQIDAVRAMDGESVSPVARSRARPAPPPKGHEAFLKALELSGATVCVQKINGAVVVGVLRHSDKYTLTVRASHDGGTRDRVLFKHDISEFYSLTPRVKAG